MNLSPRVWLWGSVWQACCPQSCWAAPFRTKSHQSKPNGYPLMETPVFRQKRPKKLKNAEHLISKVKASKCCRHEVSLLLMYYLLPLLISFFNHWIPGKQLRNDMFPVLQGDKEHGALIVLAVIRMIVASDIYAYSQRLFHVVPVSHADPSSACLSACEEP